MNLSLTSHSSSCAFLRFVFHVAKAQRTSGRQGCCSILPYSVGFARLLPVAFSVNVCQDAYSGRECFISSLHGLRKRSERMCVKNGRTCHCVPRMGAVISAPVSSLTGSCLSLSRTFSTAACSADRHPPFQSQGLRGDEVLPTADGSPVHTALTLAGKSRLHRDSLHLSS